MRAAVAGWDEVHAGRACGAGAGVGAGFSSNVSTSLNHAAARSISDFSTAGAGVEAGLNSFSGSAVGAIYEGIKAVSSNRVKRYSKPL